MNRSLLSTLREPGVVEFSNGLRKYPDANASSGKTYLEPHNCSGRFVTIVDASCKQYALHW